MNNAVPSWLFPEGASAEVLTKLETEVGALPRSYLDTLRLGNGGEAGLTVDPFNLCLEPAEAALDYWRSGTYPLSGVFVFGGNGGGSLLAFEMNIPGEWPIVSFDPIDPQGSIKEIAPDFESLLDLVGGRDA
jgi:hypothetical protein